MSKTPSHPFFLPSRITHSQTNLRSIFIALFVAAILVGGHIEAQTTVLNTSAFVTNITSTPEPGQGHDYLHDLNETVNPANGAVSIRIEATRPKERGLNNPIYAFIYDSDMDYTVTMHQTLTNCYPPLGQNLASTNYGPAQCVAEIGQPQLLDTWQQAINAGASPTSFNTGPNTITYDRQHTFLIQESNEVQPVCQATKDYVYEDVYGVRHALGMLYIHNATSYLADASPFAVCQHYFNITPQPLGGDPHYKSMIGNLSPEYTFPNSVGFLPFVVNAQGTWVTQTTQSPGSGDGVLEDANGNFQNSTGRSGSYQGFQHLLPSLGTSTSQYPGAAGTYTYTVSNTPMTYSIGYQDITQVQDYLCGGSNGDPTNVSNRASGNTNNGSTMQHPRYTAIKLPNGLSYNISYDPVYGLISKVVYPTGAWVEYTWAPNLNSEVMGWSVSDGDNTALVLGVGGEYNGSDGNNHNNFCYFRHDFPALSKRVVSYDGTHPAQEQDFVYSTVWNTANPIYWDKKSTTVTTIDLIRPGNPSTKTIYNYLPAAIVSGVGDHVQTSGLPQEDSILYQDGSGNVLKTVKKIWTGALSTDELAAECETLPSGATSGHFYKYAPYPTYFQEVTGAEETDQVTDLAEYDYGTVSAGCTRPTSTPSRETTTTFAQFGNTPLWPVLTESGGTSATFALPNLWGKPSTEKVYDHGKLLAETDYAYDETGLQNVSSPIGHDETNYGAGKTLIRGNPTTVTRQCFKGSQSCANEVTRIAYDTTGQPVSVIDGNGNQTTLDYTDEFTNDDGSASSGVTNTYLTRITRTSTANASHVSSYQYDFDKGELRARSDENGQITSFRYDDPWNRLTQVVGPPDANSGGQSAMTEYIYSDAGPSPSITTKVLQGAGVWKENASIMDGMGHITQTQLISDPSGTDVVDMTYDGMGELLSLSNPYRLGGTAPGPAGTTTYTYDALGRETVETKPDHNLKSYCYNGVSGQGGLNCTANQSSKPNVSWTDITDEAGRHRQRASDGLGRLVAVVEPDQNTGTLKSETDYNYDGLDNLTSVTQSGNGNLSQTDLPEAARSRAFAYDSLSHLTNACNPETTAPGQKCDGTYWSTSYLYDANGNLSAKTDANGMTLSYQYDALNRLLTKAAPDIDAPPGGVSVSSLGYDQGPNGIGRLTSQSRDGVAGEAYSYDAMGRVIATQWLQYQPRGFVNGMQAQYDLAGNPIQLTYPDGRVLQQQWDGAGRLGSVTDVTPGGAGTVYFSGTTGTAGSFAQYWPSGALASSAYANGITQNFTLNSRLQPCRSTATSTAVGYILDRQSYYAASATSPCGSESNNNGNIYSITDNLQPSSSQSFGYDALNRLTGGSRADGAYNHNYNYDSFGNMLVQDNLNSNQNYSIDPATNRLLLNNTDIVYDAAGQSIQNPYHTLGYTAEGYLRCMDFCQTGSYLVDGIGQRSFAVHGGSSNEYVYLNGQPMADLDNTGNWTDYIYANGQKIARLTSQESVITTSGSNTGPQQYSWFVSPVVNGYVVQPGDLWMYRQRSHGSSQGGVALQSYPGGPSPVTDTTGHLVDQNGIYANTDTGPSDQWLQRIFDLTPMAGNTLSLLGLSSWSSGAGDWSINYADMVIYSPSSGRVFPIFTGTQSTFNMGLCCANTSNPTLGIQSIATDPNNSAHYYLADHLGSTQFELSSAGTPVWQTEFTPFGEEIVNGIAQGYVANDGTAMRYKFTGKERDAESGLDYFGARYYASTMGRWMSPDWAAKPEAVPYSSLDNPQSLNLYTYVLNNPLSKADPDGHECCDQVVNFISGLANAFVSDNAGGLGRQDQGTAAGRYGAVVGDLGAAGQGVVQMIGGGAAALGGGSEALVTSPAAVTGVGAVLPAAGAGVAVAGAAVAVDGAAVTGTATNALLRVGGSFSQAQKQAAKDAAGGKCQNCGAETTPGQKSEKGVTPPGTQGEGDHVIPKSKGGTNGSDNIQHLCRDCNAAKGNKLPGQQ